MNDTWHNIIYPEVLQHTPMLILWRGLFCRHGWHLWSEMWTVEEQHTLFCDACHKTLFLADVTRQDRWPEWHRMEREGWKRGEQLCLEEGMFGGSRTLSYCGLPAGHTGPCGDGPELERQ